MTNYKYMITSGLGEYVIVTTSKTQMKKTCKEFARHDYNLYLETMEYLGESPELTLKDFYFDVDFEIENYDADCPYMPDVIHYISKDGKLH